MERERGREGDIETFFVRRPEEKRPIECWKHAREDNIKMGLKETGWEDVGWLSGPGLGPVTGFNKIINLTVT
jgi:hypothetical protein